LFLNIILTFHRRRSHLHWSFQFHEVWRHFSHFLFSRIFFKKSFLHFLPPRWILTFYLLLDAESFRLKYPPRFFVFCLYVHSNNFCITHIYSPHSSVSLVFIFHHIAVSLSHMGETFQVYYELRNCNFYLGLTGTWCGKI
jgi:hypothetical protein